MDSDDGSTDGESVEQDTNVTQAEENSNDFNNLSDVENYGECSEVKAEIDPLGVEQPPPEENVRQSFDLISTFDCVNFRNRLQSLFLMMSLQ